MKAVFDTKPTSIYDDDQTAHYQFPHRYLSTVRRCEGDWVVLRRPRADGGNLAYFAVARVVAIEQDSDNRSMSYARFSDFMQFDSLVPWRVDGRYAEEALRNIPQAQVGVYLRGRSVRPISEADFAALVASGLQRTLSDIALPEISTDTAEVDSGSFSNGPPEERERRVQSILTNRVVREANFRRLVCDAYNDCCAVTGLRILDHSGNPEAQAAHIWPVSLGGPDVIQNGIALSATVHWLFDRHLISLTDDYRLLVAENNIPAEISGVFGRMQERIALPEQARDRPHRLYIKKHRELFLQKNGKK